MFTCLSASLGRVPKPALHAILPWLQSIVCFLSRHPGFVRFHLASSIGPDLSTLCCHPKFRQRSACPGQKLGLNKNCCGLTTFSRFSFFMLVGICLWRISWSSILSPQTRFIAPSDATPVVYRDRYTISAESGAESRGPAWSK